MTNTLKILLILLFISAIACSSPVGNNKPKTEETAIESIITKPDSSIIINLLFANPDTTKQTFEIIEGDFLNNGNINCLLINTREAVVAELINDKWTEVMRLAKDSLFTIDIEADSILEIVTTHRSEKKDSTLWSIQLISLQNKAAKILFSRKSFDISKNLTFKKTLSDHLKHEKYNLSFQDINSNGTLELLEKSDLSFMAPSTNSELHVQWDKLRTFDFKSTHVYYFRNNEFKTDTIWDADTSCSALENFFLGRHHMRINRVKKYVPNWGAHFYKTGDAIYLKGELIQDPHVKWDSSSFFIKGKVELINKRKFKFKGKIYGQPDWPKNAKGCNSEDEYTFKITKGRNYWRAHERNGKVIKPCATCFCYMDIYYKEDPPF